MRMLTKEEKEEYEFLLQFVETKKIEIKKQKPPEGFDKW